MIYIKNETKGIKFSNDLFDMNKKGKKDNDTKVDIIERPQTAHIRSNLTRNFEKLYEEINILKGKNEEKEEVIKEEVIKEEVEEEKEPLKEEKVEEVKEEEKPKEENNINNDKEIKEEKKPKAFVPHEIKERKVVEEEWTMIKKGKKNRKPQ